jgi:transcriptional regulator NrdR family protein
VCEAWTIVKETRKRLDNTTKRRYECGNMHRFNTIERVEEVKPGGARKKQGAKNA